MERGQGDICKARQLEEGLVQEAVTGKVRASRKGQSLEDKPGEGTLFISALLG